MAAGNENEPPSMEERYELATNASNLRQEADRRGAADILRDMAMSTDRLGGALRRLRAQWERVEKPVRPRTRSVKEWLAELPQLPEGQYPVRDGEGKTQYVTRAQAAEYANREEREQHDLWHERELARLASLLPDLPAVRDALALQAFTWGMGKPGDPIERSERTEQRRANEAMLAGHRKAVEAATNDAERMAAQATLNYWTTEVRRIERQEADEDRARAHAKASAVVRYWLDLNCPACEGTKWQTVQGTNRHSTKVCKACHGSGVAPVPHSQDGRKLANYLDQCLHRHEKARKERRKDIDALPPITRSGPSNDED